jgi:hypothetical protein
MDFQSSLPPLYLRWMEELLTGPIPPETEAACTDCPMCMQDPARNRSGYTFNTRTKCCTYMPDLPNYLVGRIYLDRSPESAAGRSAFQAQLKRGLIVVPLGMFPPPAFAERYRRNISRFGQDPEMRCPYYLEEQGGLCGVWRHRNARCASWFCRYVRGSAGVIFWKYIDSLLTTVERLLPRWCVLQLDPGEDAMRRLFPPPPSERLLNDLPLMWGRWRGHEREFYEASAELVDALSWGQVSSICGAEVQTASRLTRLAYADLISMQLPSALKLGNWKKRIQVDDALVRIWSYNQYDPIDVPRALAGELAQFDGRPVAEVRAALSMKGISLDDSVLRKLIDFGVLVQKY